jgi:hypothetical protein
MNASAAGALDGSRSRIPRVSSQENFAEPVQRWAGIPAKVISERLGHSTAAFTLQTYTHVIAGMDEAAANSVAAMILAGRNPLDVAVDQSVVRRDSP